MMLIEPSSEEAISKAIANSQTVCPVVAMTDRGGYDVHPEFAAPPGTKKLAIITRPATR